MKAKHIAVAAAALVAALAAGGCAEAEETFDAPYDGAGEPPVENPADLPPDPAADPLPDPARDEPSAETPHDPVADTSPDTGTCRESPCGLSPNCGCPAGQKCSLDGHPPARTCKPAGAGSRGSTCEGDDDCAAGYVCMSTSSAATIGACFAFCNGPGDCPGDGSVCMAFGDGGVPVEGARVCSYSCDLVTNVGCPTGHGCDLYQYDANGDTVSDQDVTNCNSDIGLGRQDSACARENGCAAGYFCYLTEGLCLGYCYVGISMCAAGHECISFEPPAVIGSKEVGACYPLY